MKFSKHPIRKELVLNLLWFPLNAEAAALLVIVIPTQILLFVPAGHVGNAVQATFLGWLSTVASVISLFMPPIIGEISDHTPGAFGRRRPYIIIGGLLMVASTPFLVSASTIAIFLIGLSILHIGRNVLLPAYQSLVPDQVPKKKRGEASGYVGGMTVLGNAVSLGLAAWLLGGINQHAYSKAAIRYGAGIYYIVTALAVFVAMLITVIGVREAPYMPSKNSSQETSGEPRHSALGRFAEEWLEPWHSYNFTVVFLTRSFIMLGLMLFMTFVEYYFARVQGVSNFVQVTAVVAVLALGGGVVSGLVFGILSDRFKRRAPIVTVSSLSMSLISFVFVILPGHSALAWLWPIGVLFGLGYGAYTSVDWALSIDVLPRLEDAGKDLGLWGSSMTIPAIIAPLLGSLLINVADHFGQVELGYRLVFMTAALCLAIAGACVLLVREGKKSA